MTSSFVVLYGANVGSSPLIRALSNHPGVVVNIYEDIDWYLLDDSPEFGGLAERRHLPGVIRVLLSQDLRPLRQADPLSWRLLVRKAVERQDAGAGPEEAAFGFKWRPWGVTGVTRFRLARVFTERNTRPVVCVRRDVTFSALKVVFNRLFAEACFGTPGNEHLQFKAMELHGPEYETAVARAASFTFAVDDQALPSFTGWIRTEIETYRTVLRTLDAFDQAPLVLEAEDITANLAGAMASVLHAIGLPDQRDAAGVNAGAFRRIGMRRREQCTNLDRVVERADVRKLVAAWNKVHERLLETAVQAADRPDPGRWR